MGDTCGVNLIYRLAAATTAVMWLTTSAFAQNHRITDTTDATLTATAAFGTLTPGTSATPISTQVQFRLRSRQAGGYRIDGQATFTTTLNAAVAGGTTVSASDIGVGITSILPAAGADLPRADVISAGFSYDPSTKSAVNGLTPFTGAASGQATLADLSASRKLLSGNRIAANINTGGGTTNYLTVTMKFAVVPQYFTPANFSSVVTLTISNGP
jgi:hypothetical protein